MTPKNRCPHASPVWTARPLHHGKLVLLPWLAGVLLYPGICRDLWMGLGGSLESLTVVVAPRWRAPLHQGIIPQSDGGTAALPPRSSLAGLHPCPSLLCGRKVWTLAVRTAGSSSDMARQKFYVPSQDREAPTLGTRAPPGPTPHANLLAFTCHLIGFHWLLPHTGHRQVDC